MAALRKFRFAAATLAVRIPFATVLTAANLSQSYQITTHCTNKFASIHSMSKIIRTSSNIAIVMVLKEGSPFAWRMLGIPELQLLLQIFVNNLFTVLKRLSTWVTRGTLHEQFSCVHSLYLLALKNCCQID